MARTVTSSGKWPAGFVGADQRKWVYWVDGGALKGEITDTQNNVIEATFTVVASGVADSGIAAWESVEGPTRRVILWYTESGGDLIEVISADGGKTFA